MNRMNLNTNEIEFLFKAQLLSKSLIDIMENFEILYIEINCSINNVEQIAQIIYDVESKKNSNKIVVPLNIKDKKDFCRISKLKNNINFVNIINIDEIDDELFLNFSKLEKIEFHANVYKIGNSSFKGCTSLTEIIIPSTVISIGSNAFDGCTSLTEISIPSSVTSVGNNIFNGIKKINLSKGMTSIPSNLFNGCTSLTEISIPSTVTSIGSNAFDGCTSLTEISIPSSVTSVGNNIFNGIKKINLSKGMTSIPSNLFNGCTSLTEISIPSTITSIGQKKFNGCSASIAYSFAYTKGQELSGIFEYLTSSTKGNIHDNRTINISASSNYGGDPRNLCDFNDLSSNSAWSNDEEEATLLFDFKLKRVKLTNYTLHTTDSGCHPMSWVVECSNNLNDWFTRDERNNEVIMNKNNFCHTFKCQRQSNEFYRYVRIRTTCESWDDDFYYYFEISAVEFFGCLKIN